MRELARFFITQLTLSNHHLNNDSLYLSLVAQLFPAALQHRRCHLQSHSRQQQWWQWLEIILFNVKFLLFWTPHRLNI